MVVKWIGAVHGLLRGKTRIDLGQPERPNIITNIPTTTSRNRPYKKQVDTNMPWNPELPCLVADYLHSPNPGGLPLAYHVCG